MASLLSILKINCALRPSIWARLPQLGMVDFYRLACRKTYSTFALALKGAVEVECLPRLAPVPDGEQVWSVGKNIASRWAPATAGNRLRLNCKSYGAQTGAAQHTVAKIHVPEDDRMLSPRLARPADNEVQCWTAGLRVWSRVVMNPRHPCRRVNRQRSRLSVKDVEAASWTVKLSLPSIV
jgi:hypothetical protein